MRAAVVIQLCLVLWTALCPAGTKEQAPASKPCTSAEEYHQRCAALCSLLDSNSAALFRAAESKWRNGDVSYPYRQESNYLYLTGEKTPSGALVLIPAGVTVHGMRGRVVHIAGKAAKDSLGGEEIFVGSGVLPEVLDSVAS